MSYVLTTEPTYAPTAEYVPELRGYHTDALFGQLVFYPFDFGETATNGARTTSFADIFYNNIWIIPKKINAGFITSPVYYDLLIWNAYFVDKALTEVINHNLDGVFIVDDVVKTYQALESMQTQIRISNEGSITLHGSIEFKFSQQSFFITIDGTRIVPLPLAYFLSDSYRFKYYFNVVTSANMLLKEQRRIVVDKYLREIDARVFIDKLGKTSAINYFDNIGGKLCGIGIPHEKMTQVANDLYGLTNIYVNEDIANYIELQNCNLLMLFDTETTKVELALIDSINTSQKLITLKYAIRGHFLKNSTIIYPAFMCIVKEVSNEARIGKYTVANIVASEVYV